MSGICVHAVTLSVGLDMCGIIVYRLKPKVLIHLTVVSISRYVDQSQHTSISNLQSHMIYHIASF